MSTNVLVVNRGPYDVSLKSAGSQEVLRKGDSRDIVVYPGAVFLIEEILPDAAPTPQPREAAVSAAPADPAEGLSWEAIAEMIDPTTSSSRAVELAGGDEERAKRVVNHFGWGSVNFAEAGLGQAVWRRRFVSSAMPGETFLAGYIADGLIVDGKWVALMDHDATYRTLDYAPFSNGTTIINGRHV